MHVLLVWNGPTNDEERSVLARREIALVRELAALDVRTSVALCGDAGRLAADLRDAGVDVHVLPVSLPPAASAIPRIPIAAMQLRRLVAELKPDVIEATEALPAIAAGLVARSSAAIYLRQHGGGRTRLHLASRLATRLTDRTIVSCEAMRDLASADDHSAPERIEVATTGTVELPPVDPSEVVTARHDLGIAESARVVCAVSRLRFEKGIDVLIRAVDQMGVGDIHLIVVGSGVEEASLRALASASRVPVHFLGHQHDVEIWLQAADVIAIPSRRQSVGRFTLEAMAAGKAIVASRVGGLPEALADAAVFVPPEDERALADALRSLLVDRALASRLGAAARERWRSRYTIAHMAASRRSAWERTLAATEKR